MKKLFLLCTLTAVMRTALGQDISSDQLLYYPFDGNANNAANTGSNNGTVVGAILTDGFDGTASSAYSFDGINDQILFGDIDLTSESFSISFWVKLPELTQGISYRLLSQRATCTVGNFFDIAASNTASLGYAIGLEMYGGTNITGHVNTGTLDHPHQWNHITFVKDNNARASKVYVNGELKSTVQWTIAANTDFSLDNTAQLGIGNSPCIDNSSRVPFKGTLDELRLHKRTLTQADLSSLVPFGLVGSYPAANESQASVSSGIHLDFNGVVSGTTVNSSAVSVSGSISGALSPTLSGGDTRSLTLQFATAFSFGEEITVSLSGLEDTLGNTMDDYSFSFTTATEAGSKLLHFSFDSTLVASDGTELEEDVNFIPTYVQDRLRNPKKAVQFPSNKYLRSTDSRFKFGQHEDFSITFWMKAPEASTARTLLNHANKYFLNLTSGGNLQFLVSGGIDISTPVRYDDNLWHHVAIVADRDGEVTIYVDGIERIASDTSDNMNLDVLSYFYLNVTSSVLQPYAGTLDELSFYNRTFTANEIKEQAENYLFVTPENGAPAARRDTDITMEFGQMVTAASLTGANFSLNGSKSGVVSFAVSGGDTRVVTINPDQPFELDEEVTLTYTNLTMENGDSESGTITFETADVDKGVLIHYPMNGNANNAKGDTLNGTVVGASLAEGFDGASNGAYSFDGDDYLSIAPLELADESFAISFWMKKEDKTERLEIVGQREACTQGQFMEISTAYNLSYGKHVVSFTLTEMEGGFTSHTVYSDIEAEVWTHITCVRDAKNGKMSIYRNGKMMEERAFENRYSIFNTASMGIATGNPCINVDGRLRYSGAIDEFRLYRRFLDTLEIEQLTNFLVESVYPRTNGLPHSSTSSILIDFNEELNTANFGTSNVSITSSGDGALDYSVSVSNDSIRITPDAAWPAGETLTVTLTDLESEGGETLESYEWSFAVATDEETIILSIPFDNETVDQSASEFTLTPYQTFTYAQDRLKNDRAAANFEVKNSANYLTVTASDENRSQLFFGAETDFTIATWFKSNQLNVVQTLYHQVKDVAQIQAWMETDGKLHFKLANGDNVQSVHTTARFDDNMWHHVAFVADRDGDLSIYVDGILMAAAAVSRVTNVNTIINPIIGSTNSNTSHFKGLLDDFRLYRKALSAQEVNNLAPVYVAITPRNNDDAIELDQSFTIEFGRMVDASTAIASNFTLEASDSGTKTFTISGGGTRTLTLDPNTDFTSNEEVTLSFANLTDTAGNSLPDQSFSFETVGIHKGLYVYYPFAGNATNQVANEYDGVVTGATLVADRNGNAESAYSFDGDDFIEIGALPHSTESFTYSFWINRADIQETQAVFAQRSVCNQTNLMTIGCSWSSSLNQYVIGLSLASTASGSYVTASVSSAIEVSTWTHVSLVRDNEAQLLKVYLNGTLEAVQSFDPAMDISNSAIAGIASGSACINVDNTRRFRGSLDDVRIYRRAITETEAAALPDLSVTAPTVSGSFTSLDIQEDASERSIVKIDTLFSSSDRLRYFVKSSNDNLAVRLDGDLLMAQPEADYFGESEVTVSAYNGLRSDWTFTVNTTPINDAPQVTGNESIVLSEDFTSGQVYFYTASQPANENDQTITYSISPDPSEVTIASLNFDVSTGQLSINAVEDAFGEQELTIIADDGQTENNTGSKVVTLNIQPVNDAPIFELSATELSLGKNFTEATSVSVTDQSPANESGQTITYSISPSTVDFVNLTIDSQTGEVSFAAVSDATGTQDFTLTANDGQSENATFSANFTLHVLNNQPPTVVDAIADQTLQEDQSSEAIIIREDITTVFSDAENDALSYSVASDNNQIVAAINGNALAVQLAANYFGSALISLTASDGNSSVTDEFRITVTAVNDAPTLDNPIADQSATEGQAFSFSFPANTFSDVDGDDLTITSVNFEGLNGTSGDWMNFNSETSLLSGTPAQSNVGTTRVTITVSDGSLSASDVFDVMVANVNDAPIVTNPQNPVLEEDANPLVIDLNTVFSDADGDALSFSLSNGAGDILVVNRSITGSELTITPLTNENGSVSFGLFASDGQLSTSYNMTVTVNPVNDAPVINNPVTDLSIPEKQGWALTMPSNQFLDVDGDALTVSVSYDANWLSWDAASATLSGTPQAEDIGNYTVSVSGSDGEFTATYQFVITVQNVNEAPMALLLSNTTVEEHSGLVVGVLSTEDPDAGDTHTYELAAGKEETDNNDFEIVMSDGAFVLQLLTEADFELKSSYVVSIQSTDAGGLSIASQFEITVLDGVDPLGLEDQMGLKVYPNPVVRVLQVESNVELKTQLFDLQGHLILQGKSGQPMDMSPLPKGIYLLRCTDRAGSVTTQKVVKH